ncbi:MAG: hypothetical protein ACJ8F7_15000 [Gemmataceae bacterium]
MKSWAKLLLAGLGLAALTAGTRAHVQATPVKDTRVFELRRTSTQPAAAATSVPSNRPA